MGSGCIAAAAMVVAAPLLPRGGSADEYQLYRSGAICPDYDFVGHDLSLSQCGDLCDTIPSCQFVHHRSGQNTDGRCDTVSNSCSSAISAPLLLGIYRRVGWTPSPPTRQPTGRSNNPTTNPPTRPPTRPGLPPDLQPTNPSAQPQLPINPPTRPPTPQPTPPPTSRPTPAPSPTPGPAAAAAPTPAVADPCNKHQCSANCEGPVVAGDPARTCGWDRTLRRCSVGQTTSDEERTARYESVEGGCPALAAADNGDGDGGSDADSLIWLGCAVATLGIGAAVFVAFRRHQHAVADNLFPGGPMSLSIPPGAASRPANRPAMTPNPVFGGSTATTAATALPRRALDAAEFVAGHQVAAIDETSAAAMPNHDAIGSEGAMTPAGVYQVAHPPIRSSAPAMYSTLSTDVRGGSAPASATFAARSLLPTGNSLQSPSTALYSSLAPPSGPAAVESTYEVGDDDAVLNGAAPDVGPPGSTQHTVSMNGAVYAIPVDAIAGTRNSSA